MKQALTLTQIKALLLECGLSPNKKLGQNFLIDGNILRAIVYQSGITKTDSVLEIGAGLGSLTLELSRQAGRVVTVELDGGLVRALNSVLSDCANVQLIPGDILKQDLGHIHTLLGGGDIKVCANLPYYITTPVLSYLMESSLPISSMTLLVQREVARRFAASPGTPDYGALSVYVQMRYSIRPLTRVPPGCFYPQPKVYSEAVHLTALDEPPFSSERMAAISRLVRAGFAMRRKTLLNNILQAYPIDRARAESCLKEAGIQLNVRAEHLDMQAFGRLQFELFHTLAGTCISV